MNAVTYHFICINGRSYQIGHWDAKGHWHRAENESPMSKEQALTRVAEMNAERRQEKERAS